jgi:hypothetical protein
LLSGFWGLRQQCFGRVGMKVDGAAKPSSSGTGAMGEGSGGDAAAAATMEGRFADLCKVRALLKFNIFPVQVRILLPS